MPDIEENIEKRRQRTSEFGAYGEHRASEYLRQRGYRIIIRNFRTAIGRTRKGVSINGEIDLIALKSGVLCFIEVKARSQLDSRPETAVTNKKQRQITRTAAIYRNLFTIKNIKTRFDVITIVENFNKAPRIKHFKNYWSADKFEKTASFREYY